MGLLIWLEESAYAELMRVSAYGYAAMITLHSLGLAIIVGLSVIASLRALGVFGGLPRNALQNFFVVAWVGFLVNLFSGTSLFVMQASTYITDLEFLLKMLFVALGTAFVALLQNADAKTAANAADAAPSQGTVRFFAGAMIFSWAGAMIFGRLIAYL